jgi:membrane protein
MPIRPRRPTHGQEPAAPDTSNATRFRALATDVGSCLHGHDLWLYAAGLTFYTSIAAVPLLLLCLAFAGAIVGQAAVEELTARLISYLPGDVRDLIALGPVHDMNLMVGGAALLAALIPATSYGEGLSRAFGRFADQARSRALRGRLLSLLLVVVLQVATLGVLLAVDVLPDLLGIGFGARALGTYLTFLVGWFLSAGVIAAIYALFPPLRLGGPSVLWAAAATGSFFTGMSMGWLLLLRFGVDVGLAYGGSAVVGTLVLAGIYFFLVQVVVLTGFVLALELDRRGGNPLGARTGNV